MSKELMNFKSISEYTHWLISQSMRGSRLSLDRFISAYSRSYKNIVSDYLLNVRFLPSVTQAIFGVRTITSVNKYPAWDGTTLVMLKALRKEYRNHETITEVLEIGTGPHATLAIVLAKEAKAKVTALEVIPQFVEAAKKTARQNGVYINIKESNLFEALLPDFDRWQNHFDMVVTNPPYVPTSKLDSVLLKPKEPWIKRAYNGGADGTDVIKGILSNVSLFMKKEGKLLLGFNSKHVPSRKVRTLIEAVHLKVIHVITHAESPCTVLIAALC